MNCPTHFPRQNYAHGVGTKLPEDSRNNCAAVRGFCLLRLCDIFVSTVLLLIIYIHGIKLDIDRVTSDVTDLEETDNNAYCS